MGQAPPTQAQFQSISHQASARLFKVDARGGAQLRTVRQHALLAIHMLKLGCQQLKVLGHVSQPRPLATDAQQRRPATLACTSSACLFETPFVLGSSMCLAVTASAAAAAPLDRRLTSLVKDKDHACISCRTQNVARLARPWQHVKFMRCKCLPSSPENGDMCYHLVSCTRWNS